MIVQVVHGSCCSRTAGWGPPLILAVFAIRVGNSKALLVIRVETIVRIVFLSLIFIFLIIVIVFLVDSKINTAPPPYIVYVDSWSAKRTDVEIIAQQKVAAARGEAEAQIERARGEAESNRLVAASLTEAILQNRYIEKLSDQISVMLVPSDGGGLILDLGSLTPTPSQTP